jgi:hypothetical protein
VRGSRLAYGGRRTPRRHQLVGASEGGGRAESRSCNPGTKQSRERRRRRRRRQGRAPAEEEKAGDGRRLRYRWAAEEEAGAGAEEEEEEGRQQRRRGRAAASGTRGGRSVRKAGRVTEERGGDKVGGGLLGCFDGLIFQLKA